VGRHIDLIVPPTRAEEVSDILRRVSWGETIENYETERLCNDGSLVQFRCDFPIMHRRD
jgi:hypothetical protein